MQRPLQEKEDRRNSNTREAATFECGCSKTVEVEEEKVSCDNQDIWGELVNKRVVRGIIYRLGWSGGVALSVEVDLEGDLRWGWSACQFLLFLEFFASGLNGDCETNLGLLLNTGY